MPSSIVYLEKAIVFRLDGDMVHYEAKSGRETFHRVLNINQFMATHAAAKRIIDEWAAQQRGEVVRLLKTG